MKIMRFLGKKIPFKTQLWYLFQYCTKPEISKHINHCHIKLSYFKRSLQQYLNCQFCMLYFLAEPLLLIKRIHLGKNALLYTGKILVIFWNTLQMTRGFSCLSICLQISLCPEQPIPMTCSIIHIHKILCRTVHNADRPNSKPYKYS
jgi:hypothetical protein